MRLLSAKAIMFVQANVRCWLDANRGMKDFHQGLTSWPSLARKFSIVQDASISSLGIEFAFKLKP